MQATLGHLVTVRAQRTVALLTYLRALVDLPDQNAPTFVGALRVTDSYIPPDVWKVPGTGERPPGSWRHRNATSFSTELQDAPGRDGYKSERVAWEREWRLLKRVLILGAPGMGKALLTWMTIRAIAQTSLLELTAQRKRKDELNIPVYVRLADAVEQGLKGAVDDSLRSAVESLHPGLDHSRVITSLTYALDSDRYWLFLDALDEVPRRESLRATLKPLRHAATRVIVTSRPYSYDRLLLPFAQVTEYELAPFTQQCGRTRESAGF